MNIMLINPYGPIPIPEEKWRDYRFTIIGKYLSSEGHNVVWYTSSFSHHFKKQRSEGWKDIEVDENFKIRLVPTPGYDKNVSFGRILRDWVFSYKVYNHNIPEKVDLMIYSESPLSFGFAGYQLAKKKGVPVIYDQMDLWPELIVNAFPASLRKLAALFFAPVFRNRKSVYSKLNGFISLAKPYMEIPLSIAPNLRNKPNEIIYNGIDVVAFRNEAFYNPQLEKLLPEKQEGEIWFTFAGTLGPSYDILNLLSVASEIYEKSSQKIKFLIAGDGPLKKEVNDFISKDKKGMVVYVGKLNPEDLVCLYKKSDVGLSIYTAISNVEMPDKIYDYTAAGLAVINSLRGEVGSIVSRQNIGVNYEAGNKESLLNAIIKLVEDTNARKSYAKNSAEIGLSFDKNNQIQKLGPLIEAVMKEFKETKIKF